MATKPSVPKGTRDFSPTELLRRNYIFNKIQEQFQLFGFQQIETPSFENTQTLMGKYGQEGDRLIFKILNSGDFLSKVPQEIINQKDSQKAAPLLSEKALRYDLTVPFARYVVQHQNDIVFPFKRFQIQPVWRADRPQKGRFREFYQCDADAVGASSLWQEVEFVQLYNAVFQSLGIEGVTLRMNNRKILAGFAQIIGQEDKLTDFTVALDKLDKIGKEKVMEEMLSKGISEQSIEKITPIFSLQGDFWGKISVLEQILSESQTGLKGIEELRFIGNALKEIPLQITVNLDVTLARGLNYYTGAIFEVAAPEQVQIGSIGGGGRYDDLTSIFGLKGISGVGISFGLDRIYLVMEELGLFPQETLQQLGVLFINFGDEEALKSLQIISLLREKNISCELFPEAAKLKKQLTYADKRGARYTAMIGQSELQEGKIMVKNMQTGEQQTFSLNNPEEIVKYVTL